MIDEHAVNILLVDDQPAKLLSYEVILQQLGENLIKAGSAREALAHLLKNEVAVILVDVCMPDQDGFELAAMIREHPRFRETAIIFVSAIAMTDLDRLRGYACGAVDYVPVPVDPNLLRAKVRVFAELHRKTRQLERLNIELERRVAERTVELAAANAELERRVAERTREREEALAQVHEMQKLESLGQVTGGLAHDFNNLLAAIMGNLELLAKRLPDDPRLFRLVAGARDGAERGATLTKRLLAFARRQELQPEIVDVPALVGGMTDMLRRSLGPAIQINTDFQKQVGSVQVDPNQLELALLNLALNARDAMPIGGNLLIRAHAATVTGGELGLLPGDYACVMVADTGTGMDEVTLRRATEPFFTTKGIGRGTGLGLSMVHGLAAQSGGAMRISSRIGCGTSVELWLPIAHGSSAPAPDSVAPSETPAVFSRRILVVDDDPLVLASTVAMLEDLGHLVLEADSGQPAIDLLNLTPEIDLVITDYAMPGMTGAELARHVHALWPDMPVILATGYADLAPGTDLNLPRLSKPYKQIELSTLIAIVLREQERGNLVAISTAKCVG